MPVAQSWRWTVNSFLTFLVTAAFTFGGMFIAFPLLLAFLRMMGGYVIVPERRAFVYILFGRTIGIIDEPGFHILLFRLGPAAFIVHWLGQCRIIDLRLDQVYLRSQPVNSEEGAPMGIGIWYEMFISDPVSYLFKNSDPRGSLAANVSSATVRCLSNMKLTAMMENRHEMSRTVRAEVSATSKEWGYDLGSVYIRKVHFRDVGMMQQIESKVVNRLRQVTSAIKQDGANQVSVITSTAERQAAVEFAKAAALRPQIVGGALEKISEDPQLAQVLFEVLETERMMAHQTEITLIPKGGNLLPQLLAAESVNKPIDKKTPPPV